MMNPYARQAKEYKAREIETASQEEILILLFEGAIRFLNIARKATVEGEAEKAHKHLIRAQNIIMELMTSLDMKIGGEVAKNLYALYEYLHFRLVQANIKRDVEMIDEVLGHMRSLKETWEEAIKIATAEKLGMSIRPIADIQASGGDSNERSHRNYTA